jgi:hypothetical protein
MKKIFLSIFSLSVIFWGVASAQGQPNKEKLQSLHRAYVSDRLQLTPEESAHLFPLLEEFKGKMREINRSFLDDRPSKKIEDMSNEESARLLDRKLEREERLLALRREYLDKLRRVLPPQKVARLEQVEKDFKHEVLSRMKERRGGRGPGRPGPR